MSFSEFVQRRGVSRMGARAFQVHVKQHHGQFNFRSESEWQRLYSEYLAADRTRRSSR